MAVTYRLPAAAPVTRTALHTRTRGVAWPSWLSAGGGGGVTVAWLAAMVAKHRRGWRKPLSLLVVCVLKCGDILGIQCH